MEIVVFKNLSLTFTNNGMQTSSQLCSFQEFVLPKPEIKPIIGNFTKAKCHEKLYQVLYIQPENSRPPGYKLLHFGMFAAVGTLDFKPSTLEILWGTKYQGSFFLKLLSMKNLATEVNLYADFSQGEFQLIHTEPIPTTWTRENGVTGIKMSLQNIPTEILSAWNVVNATLTGIFHLSVVFNKNIVKALCSQADLPQNSASITLEKMLTYKTHADMCLVPERGQLIKCHRAVIVTKSVVLAEKLTNGTRNDATNLFEIKVNDMDEKEVTAFVTFLYKSYLEEALTDVKLCFRMLKAGYVYKVIDLMCYMRQLISIRGNEEIGVDLATQILVFVMEIRRSHILTSGSLESKENPGPGLLLKTQDKAARIEISICNDLTLKSIHVLKWYSQEDPVELENSQFYKNLYVETPQIAMELDSKLFQYSDTDGFNLNKY